MGILCGFQLYGVYLFVALPGAVLPGAYDSDATTPPIVNMFLVLSYIFFAVVAFAFIFVFFCPFLFSTVFLGCLAMYVPILCFSFFVINSSILSSVVLGTSTKQV